MDSNLYEMIFKRKSFHLFRNIGNEHIAEEELGIDLNDNHWKIKLKYLKYPSEKENPIAYPVETIYEAKTTYTKDEVEQLFKTTNHDNETSRLIYFNKNNYEDIYNYKQKKEYMTELWERIFLK